MSFAVGDGGLTSWPVSDAVASLRRMQRPDLVERVEVRAPAAERLALVEVGAQADVALDSAKDRIALGEELEVELLHAMTDHGSALEVWLLDTAVGEHRPRTEGHAQERRRAGRPVDATTQRSRRGPGMPRGRRQRWRLRRRRPGRCHPESLRARRERVGAGLTLRWRSRRRCRSMRTRAGPRPGGHQDVVAVVAPEETTPPRGAGRRRGRREIAHEPS